MTRNLMRLAVIKYYNPVSNDARQILPDKTKYGSTLDK